MLTASQFIEHVPHSRDLGMEVVSVKGKRVCMRLTPKPWMLADDGGEEIWSSIMYSLADSTCGLAVFAEVQRLSPVATLDLRLDYLQPANGKRPLLAVASCRHLTDDIAFIECEIHSEGEGEPVATGSATFMRNTHGPRFQATGGKRPET